MKDTRRVQEEFAKQASGFGDPRLTVARADYLEWMLGYLPIGPEACVLDVCAGTGHISRAIAPRVRRVVAVDVTAEMLAELAKSKLADRLPNVLPVRALGE